MDHENNLQKLEASPIHKHGAKITRFAIRGAMIAAVVAVFFSPAATKPKQSYAASCDQSRFSNEVRTCSSGATNCQFFGGTGGGWCMGTDGSQAMPTSSSGTNTGDTGGGANAPEMPALLVPLFLAVSGGMAYRIRRKNLAKV